MHLLVSFSNVYRAFCVLICSAQGEHNRSLSTGIAGCRCRRGCDVTGPVCCTRVLLPSLACGTRYRLSNSYSASCGHVDGSPWLTAPLSILLPRYNPAAGTQGIRKFPESFLASRVELIQEIMAAQRVALVTASSGGLGAAIARSMCRTCSFCFFLSVTTHQVRKPTTVS